MTHAPGPALEAALAAYRAPSLLLRLRQHALPPDLSSLLRIAGGDAQARAGAAAVSGEPESVVVAAARLYIQQVMFYRGSDSYRVLGAQADADAGQLKENHRWLVHWLHPDRLADDWEAVYADRVNHAWHELRTPERRQAYDLRIGRQQRLRSPPSRPSPRSGRSPAQLDATPMSAQTVRRLPTVILGGLAIAASALLGLQYFLLHVEPMRRSQPAERMASVDQEKNGPPASPVAERSPTSPAMSAAHASVPTVEARAMKPAPAVPAVLVPPAPPKLPPAPPLMRERKTLDAPLHPRAGVAAVARPIEAMPRVGPTLVPGTTVASLDQQMASQLLGRFRSAYASGNIEQLRSLLSKRRFAWRNDRKEILKSYGELFDSSERRHIEFHNPNWIRHGDTAIFIARYEAWILPRGELKERHVSGDIRFDLRRENGELRIVRLRHASS